MTVLSPAQVRALKAAIGYKGRKEVMYVPFQAGMRVNSYWSGGSRDYWFLVNVKSFVTKEIPQNGTPFDKLDLTCDVLAPNEVLVKVTHCAGRQLAPIIYMNG